MHEDDAEVEHLARLHPERLRVTSEPLRVNHEESATRPDVHELHEPVLPNVRLMATLEGIVRQPSLARNRFE